MYTKDHYCFLDLGVQMKNKNIEKKTKKKYCNQLLNIMLVSITEQIRPDS